MHQEPCEKIENAGNQLIESIFPSEETVYRSYFKKTLWTLDEFSALMSGISPEKCKKIKDNPKDESLTRLDLQRAIAASQISSKFLQHIDEINITDEIELSDNEFCMSPWKYIKWISFNGILMKKKFFKELPLYLIELYLEFSPANSPLRTKPKRSRAYHEALYLKNARDLINKFPHRLTREEIYTHSRMQNVHRQIRMFGGNYTKRTITDSWLSKLEDLKRGRPPKNTPPSC